MSESLNLRSAVAGARSLLTVIASLFLTQCLVESDSDDMAIVVESRRGPWQNNPDFGNSYTGPMPVSEGIELQVLDMPSSYGSPRVHTVNLYSSPGVGAGLGNADIRAKVKYGLGAFRGEFLADWYNGAQFSLLLDTVRVTAITIAPDATAPYNVDGNVVVIGASVGAGSVSTFPLTYTEPSNIIPQAQTLYYEAPPFAKGLLLYLDDINDLSVPTRLLVVLDCGVQLHLDARLLISNSNGILLPGGTKGVSLINNTHMGGIGVDLGFSLVWTLGL